MLYNLNLNPLSIYCHRNGNCKTENEGSLNINDKQEWAWCAIVIVVSVERPSYKSFNISGGTNSWSALKCSLKSSRRHQPSVGGWWIFKLCVCLSVFIQYASEATKTVNLHEFVSVCSAFVDLSLYQLTHVAYLRAAVQSRKQKKHWWR